MKHLFNDIPEDEKNRILEMHKTQHNFQIINSNVNLNEQSGTPQLLTINPKNLNFGTNQNNSQQIKLWAKIEGKEQSLFYDISGTYKTLLLPKQNFKINLRNFKRMTDGALKVEVQPDLKILRTVLKKSAQKEFLTSDGWLIVKIPFLTLKKGIVDLSKNKGSSTTMDVGNGITINLKLAR